MPAGYASVYNIVRLHGTPVGVLWLPATSDGIRARVLAQAIVDQLSNGILRHLLADRLMTHGLAAAGEDPAVLLDTTHCGYAGPWPSVTAAICTRGRPDDLQRCLAALVNLDYPSLDLLVIDNAPTDASVADFVSDRYPNVRYVVEPRPGLDWARNRAIHETTSEILAFTDDDAVAEPGWLKALVSPFAEESEVMAIAGLVVPYELETEAQQLFERHTGFGRGFDRRWVRVPINLKTARAANVTTLGTGANMAFRRSLFDRIGGFDPALDAGTRTGAGGDIEMFFRVLKAGHAFVYEPSAVVRHRHRRDYQSIRRQLHNWLRGARAAGTSVVRLFPDEAFPIAAFGARLLVWHFPRRAIAAALSPQLRLDLVLSEFQGLLARRTTYLEAHREARAIAGRFAAGPTLPPVAVRSVPVERASRPPVRRLRIDISEPLTTIHPTDRAEHLRLEVSRSSARIGDVDIITGGAPVSPRRQGDAIVSSLLPRIIDKRRFREALRTALVNVTST